MHTVYMWYPLNVHVIRNWCACDRNGRVYKLYQNNWHPSILCRVKLAHDIHVVPTWTACYAQLMYTIMWLKKKNCTNCIKIVGAHDQFSVFVLTCDMKPSTVIVKHIYGTLPCFKLFIVLLWFLTACYDIISFHNGYITTREKPIIWSKCNAFKPIWTHFKKEWLCKLCVLVIWC